MSNDEIDDGLLNFKLVGKKRFKCKEIMRKCSISSIRKIHWKKYDTFKSGLQMVNSSLVGDKNIVYEYWKHTFINL